METRICEGCRKEREELSFRVFSTETKSFSSIKSLCGDCRSNEAMCDTSAIGWTNHETDGSMFIKMLEEKTGGEKMSGETHGMYQVHKVH
jgi:MinD superfamily P-loop ATPase